MIPMMTETVLAFGLGPEFAVLSKATFLLMVGLGTWLLAKPCRASIHHLVLAATFGTLLALPLMVLFAPEVAVGVPGLRENSPALPQQPATTELASALLRPERIDKESSETRSWPLPDGMILMRWVWATGALLFALPLAVDLWRLRRLRRNGLPAPELRTLLEAVVDGHQVELLLHEDIPAPLTCGLLRPTILLPCDAREWHEDDLRRALIHEMEHVRRADWAVQLLARAACVCYWFHPLVWMAWRRLALEAERACDDAVVQKGERADYAEQLVSLASRMSNGPIQTALGMAHRSDLSIRVTAILDARQNRGRVSRLAAATAIGLAILVVGVIGPVRAVAQSAADQDSTSAALPSRSTQFDEALFEAAERGNTADIERLLSLGANVNAKLSGDGSPLIAAARQGRNTAVQLLLDRGANPNMAVSGDGSPLIMAAEKGHLATVRLLLERGADIHMPVPGDGNPLIMAARGGSVEVVRFLLDQGANMEQVVPGDENALIEASSSGHLPVVKLLVGRGANVDARVWAEPTGNRAGEWRTPLNMARKRPHGAVVAFLQSVGARE